LLPLEGIRVLDLSRLLPGPFASMILADFGAEVVKVEEPELADYSRWAPPFYESLSVYFSNVNRNKKSITLNLKSAEGRDIFHRLAKDADVVLETFRPGVVKRLGVDFETLSELNPRLIYCSLSGYGQDGPYRDYAGHDLNIQGLGGILSFINRGEGHPIVPGLPIADFAGSLWTVIAVMMALQARDRRGGQYIDVSILDCIVSLLCRDSMFHFGNTAPDDSSFYGESPRFNVFETADGKYVTLSALEAKFWVNLCKKLGREDLINKNERHEDRLTSHKGNREEVFAFLRKAFKTKTSEEWVKELAEADVPCYPVLSIPEVFRDPHVLHRGMLKEVEHATEGTMKHIGIPVKLSQTPGEIRSHPPRLGEHTEEVLGGLGLRGAEIGALRAAGVI
jgi:crotonobetainyl-CoA:carnitine CoA-transferase CaiB-like acyl-CoA transferase